MKQLIYKYELKYSPGFIGQIQDLKLPIFAEILGVKFQDDKLTIWAIFEEKYKSDFQERGFMVCYTGVPIELPEDKIFHHIGIEFGYGLVYHLFEVMPSPDIEDYNH